MLLEVFAAILWKYLLGFAVYSQLVSGGATIADDPTRDTEVKFAFLVHRHGDRTICFVNDTRFTDKPDAVLQATREYGFGQLTLKGRQTAYKLGEFIRDRYSELLTPKYNRSEVFIRSTDCTRTKMTILTALAAIYPPVEPRWSKTVNWEPVPYTTLPVLYDFLSLGIPLSDNFQEIYDQINEAADAATEYINSQEENLELQAGPLLNDFSKYAPLIIKGIPTHKLRIYSAHDVNVYALEAITKATPKQGFPKFAAMLSLELRRNIKTGQYVVLPVYLPAPGEQPVYLNIEGCDSVPCKYNQFLQITAPYALDVDSWKKKCGWTPDLFIDESKQQ